ncbi:hypothetical protein [Chryseobacterium sp. SIMBA_038]|uniref:hypothetical protein n=1 Tax=Chryseobacterium sp. SIMBA_038 TaxID=3085780 RepID=UPI003979955A
MNLKFIIFIVLFFLFCGCKKENISGANSKEVIPKEVKYGKTFFDYDQIDYYSINLGEGKIKELYENQDKSKVDKYKYTVTIDETPETITDLDFLNYMEMIGYVKKKIDKSKFPQINKIFVEKTASDGYAAACIPVFRDILIFKKQEKVIGIAKICFSCHQYRIIGTHANKENFGTNNDYEKLEFILNSIK